MTGKPADYNFIADQRPLTDVVLAPPKPPRMKVWAGCFDGDTETIVAATSKRKAAELLEISLYLFNEYASDSNNYVHLRLALGEPGVVFSTPYRQQAWVRGNHRYYRSRAWPPDGAEAVS